MSFDSLGDLIQQLNINDDAIIMDSKIRDLADYFQCVCEDEQLLKNVMQHFNQLALNDTAFAMNLALFFASRVLDSVLPSGSQVRAEMLTILQQNYMAAENLKITNAAHFYNSITLLGEYYHRARIAANPVQILGESLLQLLTDHLRADIDRHHADRGQPGPDVRYLKLVMRQVTLNGKLARENHRTELDALLVEIRRCLMLVGDLCANGRAFLLMTLDLYYRNFGSLGAELERLYVAYVLDDSSDAELLKQKQQQQRSNATQIGLHGRTSETVVQSINGLANELSKQGSGYQRRPVIKTEYLNRPLKASDRLRFVRQQTANEVEQNNAVFFEKQRAFEQTVEQQKQQQSCSSSTTPSNNQHYNNVPEDDVKPASLSNLTNSVQLPITQQQQQQQSPQHINNHNTSSASVVSGNNGDDYKTPPASVNTTPKKTPSSRRRAPIDVPVLPSLNSDWFAEVEAHFAHGQQAAVDQLAELSVASEQQQQQQQEQHQNARNFGNGSPNKYSKSMSPQTQHPDLGYENNGSCDGDEISCSRSYDDGENTLNDQQLSPSSKSNRYRNRDNRNSFKNHFQRGGSANNSGNSKNGDNESMYTSKSSLRSESFRSTNGSNRQQQPQQRQKKTQQQPQQQQNQQSGGRQLKPANRINPFDRRSKYSQHCDRADQSGPETEQRQSMSTGRQPQRRHDSNEDDHQDEFNSPPQNMNARNNAHAAQYAKEFLEFLED